MIATGVLCCKYMSRYYTGHFFTPTAYLFRLRWGEGTVGGLIAFYVEVEFIGYGQRVQAAKLAPYTSGSERAIFGMVACVEKELINVLGAASSYIMPSIFNCLSFYEIIYIQGRTDMDLARSTYLKSKAESQCSSEQCESRYYA